MMEWSCRLRLASLVPAAAAAAAPPIPSSAKWVCPLHMRFHPLGRPSQVAMVSPTSRRGLHLRLLVVCHAAEAEMEGETGGIGSAVEGRCVTAEHDSDETRCFQPWHFAEGKNGKPLELKERCRRSKISRANKGKVPWNKGKQHLPETIERIKARTFLAMQSPRIRERLKRFGKSQSKESRLKISNTLKKRWAAYRSVQRHQAACTIEWQESIAEAARRGEGKDEEYQWDSFQQLKRKFEKESRRMAGKRERNSKKSIDHRKKISDSIRAKWADPNFRLNVMQGLQRFLDRKQGVRMGRMELTRCKKVAKERRTIEISKISDGNIIKNDPNFRKPNLLESQKLDRVSTCSDPSTDMKLDIVRQIRANWLAKAEKRRKAADRAWILMAKAEKAVRALEIEATRNKDALVPLIETRRLLSEAAHSLQAAGLVMVDRFHTPLISSSSGNTISDEQLHVLEPRSMHCLVKMEDEEHNGLSLENTYVKMYDNNDHHYINGASSKSVVADSNAKSDITSAMPDANASRGYKPTSDKPRKRWVNGKLVLLEIE